MRSFFRNSIMTVLVVLLALAASSCKKKEVKKIAVNNQFAISLFNDTISIKELLNDMDSTTATWLRVKDDGTLYACYTDSIMGVIKASDFVSNLEDVHLVSNTAFNLPPVVSSTEKDTTLTSDNFATIQFEYNDFDINEVLLKNGIFSFSIDINPVIPMLKKIVIFSEQLVSPDNDEPLRIEINYDKTEHAVDLAGYKIIPNEDKEVAFSSEITFHYDPAIGFEGGDFNCILDYGITNVGFRTIHATMMRDIDSIYTDEMPIDFGINGISGTSAMLPFPTIRYIYQNSFGFDAEGVVRKLEMIKPDGQADNLLKQDSIMITLNQTNGQYVEEYLDGTESQINALAGYTRLDFFGEVTVARAGDNITISDDSSVDVIADVEMPLQFSVDDLHYIDTVELSISNDVNIQNYLDEIDFFIDYNNQIPLQVTLQGIFMKNGHVLDSLFNNGDTLFYDREASLQCIITDSKLQNVMRANQMILRLGVSTDFNNQGPQTVTIYEHNGIALRMRMLTKTNEINIDDVL